MQKMRTIFPTICIAFLLCACSVGERGVRLDNSGKTEDSCVEAIFEILNESDRDALESLFDICIIKNSRGQLAVIIALTNIAIRLN